GWRDTAKACCTARFRASRCRWLLVVSKQRGKSPTEHNQVCFAPESEVPDRPLGAATTGLIAAQRRPWLAGLVARKSHSEHFCFLRPAEPQLHSFEADSVAVTCCEFCFRFGGTKRCGSSCMSRCLHHLVQWGSFQIPC